MVSPIKNPNDQGVGVSDGGVGAPLVVTNVILDEMTGSVEFS